MNIQRFTKFKKRHSSIGNVFFCKIVREFVDNHLKIACIWAIMFSDELIWEQRENNASIYIHRIATNPNFRGQNLVQKIVDWAKVFAKEQNRQYLRMDTCGKNDRLIQYYEKCGFSFLGMNKLQNPSELPLHYHGADVCFFELEL